MKGKFITAAVGLLIYSGACAQAPATYDCNCCDWGKVFFGSPENRRFIALKTNLLYDAAATPNLALEVGFASRWSVSADWMYAWWSREEKDRFWRIYGGNLEARYWLKKDSWTGHHFGVYGKMLTYDFAFGGDGVLAPKWQWSAGVSYGYSLPVSRNFNIDFSISVGYLGGNYRKYCNSCDDYYWKSDHHNRYIGPTRAEVSLVWLLNRKNSK